MTRIVLDASAVVEMVRASGLGARVDGLAFAPTVSRHVPSTCPVEAVSALRGLVAAAKIATDRAETAVADVLSLPARRYDAAELLPRTWQLRHNLTTYDALYVALAESLDATLMTCDAKFDTPAVTRLIDVDVVA